MLKTNNIPSSAWGWYCSLVTAMVGVAAICLIALLTLCSHSGIEAVRRMLHMDIDE